MTQYDKKFLKRIEMIDSYLFKSGMKQVAFSKKVGASQSTISAIMNWKPSTKKRFHDDLIARIDEVIGNTESEFLASATDAAMEKAAYTPEVDEDVINVLRKYMKVKNFTWDEMASILGMKISELALLLETEEGGSASVKPEAFDSILSLLTVLATGAVDAM